MINTTGDQSSLTEMNNIDEDIKEKLEILKYNMSSNQPLKLTLKHIQLIMQVHGAIGKENGS